MTADFSLAGRIAVVTGAGSGIGRALAFGLADAGAAVVIAERDEERGAATAKAISATAGGTALAVPCDVADRQSVTGMVATTMEHFGRLDILVNNAAVFTNSPALEITEDEWDRVLNVNLKGVFLCSQAAGRVMAADNSGVIINISSQLGDVAQANKAPYAASKGGVKMLTKALAVDLAPHGIRVNAVAPGPIESSSRPTDPALRAAFEKRLPVGRMGRPEELVGASIFLASDAAAFVTGSTLYVDGGYLAV